MQRLDTTGPSPRSGLDDRTQGRGPVQRLELEVAAAGRLAVTLPRALALLTCSLLSVPVLGVPTAHASTASVLESEARTVSSGAAVTRYPDASASAGAALNLRSNGALTASITTSAADELVLRLRGDQFSGAPSAVVHVDGVRVASLGVSATRWTDYVVEGAWAAAPHRVQVSFTNDHYVPGTGDRNLHVDRVVFRASTPTPTRTAPAPALDDAYESRIVALVNAERAKAGVAPLAVSPCADRYTEQWSAHMASTGQFAHRTDLGAVMRSCAARGVGENIAYGNVTPDEMMAIWMGSPEHRANILRAGFTHISVGAVTTAAGRTYGTQNFLTL